MDKKLREQLYEILNNLPSENACLDYKTIPYKKMKVENLSKI